MNRIKCVDVVNELVNEASKQFGVTWKVNEDYLRSLQVCCAAFDALSEEFTCIGFNVDIDEIYMTISITLDCISVIINKEPEHIFYALAKNAERVEFFNSQSEDLSVNFVFPSIWEKA